MLMQPLSQMEAIHALNKIDFFFLCLKWLSNERIQHFRFTVQMVKQSQLMAFLGRKDSKFIKRKTTHTQSVRCVHLVCMLVCMHVHIFKRVWVRPCLDAHGLFCVCVHVCWDASPKHRYTHTHWPDLLNVTLLYFYMYIWAINCITIFILLYFVLWDWYYYRCFPL